MDGQKQQKKAVPGDTTYPTVFTYSILTTATIDGHEGRDVKICNIPGAFISEDMDK